MILIHLYDLLERNILLMLTNLHISIFVIIYTRILFIFLVFHNFKIINIHMNLNTNEAIYIYIYVCMYL